MGVEQLKVTLNHHCGDDLTTVNAAKVSFDKISKWEEGEEDSQIEFDFSGKPFKTTKQYLSDKDTKLINYLAKHKHYSPFGHSFASFTVEAPVFVRAQLVKHKFLRLNEISRRYVDNPPEFYSPDVWRVRAENVKQGSKNGDLKKGWTQEDINHLNSESGYTALSIYNHMLEADVAPEMARMILPQSMMTSWWWSGSLDAFADMCKLRCKPDAQYETRMVAEQINTIMSGLFPVSWKALTNEL